jgi:hypothetical protein
VRHLRHPLQSTREQSQFSNPLDIFAEGFASSGGRRMEKRGPKGEAAPCSSRYQNFRGR